MATVCPGPVSAAQVGTYFVTQYYQILRQHPDFVHQFYAYGSSMLRIDGTVVEEATTMLEIHNIITSLNFIGIEIKTAHSLDSWNAGVLVMVSGSVQTREYSSWRKFVQTFFLAPQEKGFFVLNDIFQYLDEEQIHQHPAAILVNGNFDSKLTASYPLPELARAGNGSCGGTPPVISDQCEGDREVATGFWPIGNELAKLFSQNNESKFRPQAMEKQATLRDVSGYPLGGEIQSNDYVVPVHVDETETVDKYSIPEPQQQVSEADERVEEVPAEDPVVSFPSAMNTVWDAPPAPIDEPIGEPPKQTYASILRIPKGQSRHSAPHPSLSKGTPVASEWYHAPQSAPQRTHTVSSTGPETSSIETVEEFVALEEEGEVRSVYVRNLPSSVSASDIENEFKNYGRIKPDGVLVKSRKEAGIYYAFVEFEDTVGVQNALKASPIQFNGRLIYVEERRPNTGVSRGGRRGNGRVGFQSEGLRGRFGARSFGRGYVKDNGERDCNSGPRSNGFHPRGTRNGRGTLGSQATSNGQNPSDTAASQDSF